jgi:hypothetical protein
MADPSMPMSRSRRMEGLANRVGGGAGARWLDGVEGAALRESRIEGNRDGGGTGLMVWRTGGRCGSGGLEATKGSRNEGAENFRVRYPMFHG